MRALVISPHPDDSALGCGGTIRQLVKEGNEVFVIYLTSGEQGRPGHDSWETQEIREAEAEAEAEILGSEIADFWHQPDGALEVTAELVRRLFGWLGRQQPDRIFLPHPDEAHPDHQAARDLVYAVVDNDEAFKDIELWLYEVWTPLRTFDYAVDITASIEDKLAAIRCHRSQVDRNKFDMAALGLARYRGELHNRPHGSYAECFKKG